MTLTSDELSNLTVPELKAALKEMGLPTTGKKDELIARYLEEGHGGDLSAIDDDIPDGDIAANEGEAADEAGAKEDAGAVEEDLAEAIEPQSEAPPSKHPRIVFFDTKATDASKTDTMKTEVAAEKPVLSVAEKLKLREEKFGKTEAHAEQDKGGKRAERFGTGNPALEDQNKKLRAERFGTASKEDGKAGAAARNAAPREKEKLVFDAPDDHEARKKARAERFA